MARPFLFILILLAVCSAGTAHAQRLPYEDVLVDSSSPAAEDVREVYADRLEYRSQSGGDGYHWDVSAEFGSARHRLWLSTTGDGTLGAGLDYAEVQALYSRPILEAGLALQAGIRQDFVPRPRRTYAALGLQGNVSEPLYIGAFGFLSRQGEFTARLFALYDLALLPDRLILQPSFETEIAAADVPELGIGAGPVYVEGGLRLRWQLRQGFAPYVGVNWERLTGRTARIARGEGEAAESTGLVLGLRSYF